MLRKARYWIWDKTPLQYLLLSRWLWFYITLRTYRKAWGSFLLNLLNGFILNVWLLRLSLNLIALYNNTWLLKLLYLNRRLHVKYSHSHIVCNKLLVHNDSLIYMRYLASTSWQQSVNLSSHLRLAFLKLSSILISHRSLNLFGQFFSFILFIVNEMTIVTSGTVSQPSMIISTGYCLKISWLTH